MPESVPEKVTEEVTIPGTEGSSHALVSSVFYMSTGRIVLVDIIRYFYITMVPHLGNFMSTDQVVTWYNN